MSLRTPLLALLIGVILAAQAHAAGVGETAPLRAGIIGLDTSHVIAFTKIINDSKPDSAYSGVRIVAGFPGGSDDVPASHDRVGKFTEQLRGMGIEIVDSIPALLQKVDVVLIESVDGRPHLEQARQVFAAHKPVFIDKPLAGSLADAIAIAELGKKYDVPWFTSSSLRFGPGVQKLKDDPKLGSIVGGATWGPCSLEKHHPDLYWYGIHGCEQLYTYMGTGCQQVTRVQTEGTELVVGVWKDGRVGTFRGLRSGKEGYGAIVFGSKSILPAAGDEGYEPLVAQIVLFFKTRKPPVEVQETLELMTFMEAADESKRQGGGPVKLADVFSKAEAQARAKTD